MPSLPLRVPLLGSQPLQFHVLGAHSPHSSPRPAAQACLLVLQPGPLLHPDPGSDPGPGLPDHTVHSEAVNIVHQTELLFPLDTGKSETLTYKHRAPELDSTRSGSHQLQPAPLQPRCLKGQQDPAVWFDTIVWYSS